MRFTTVAERNVFASTVLHDMRPIGPVRRLALKVHDRMEKIVEGRQWMGAHMRRGDCKSKLYRPWIRYSMDLPQSLRMDGQWTAT